MSAQEDLQVQLFNQLCALNKGLEELSSKTESFEKKSFSFQDMIFSATSWPEDHDLVERLWDCRRVIEVAEINFNAVAYRVSSIIDETKDAMQDLEKIVNRLPEVQEQNIKKELMAETKRLDERELELKKSIVSKQAEIEKMQKGLKRILGFSVTLITSFTTVGILFPAVWVLSITTISVGIITLFLAFVMLSGLSKDSIIDVGNLEKDKVELDWVQTKKAQLFLESN